ncbi:MEDS domain-containing protein [Salinibacillus xinjiangensis]|uniref:MEDS domain-containing protein n=1 Tax=Salinibacillus xinjiangensis TaxID=1229268 RepID=A0A6G1X9L2_9BACI|nr:MEDS domain-containing protein [Salinibacillus xinjiangensis]MRG87586.1 hypothetical protein [Salinibacillus xinjiangensis]
MKDLISLTNNLMIHNSAHILYFYEDNQYYLQNLISYINEGIKRNHHIIVIEELPFWKEVQKRVHKDKHKYIHFVDNQQYYQCYGDFNIHHIIQSFSDLLEPLLNEKLEVRTWAHVDWKKQDNIIEKLDEFECLADCSVKNMGLMSVCAYDATKVSASIQTRLMRSHEYLMTDQELVQSSLYSIQHHHM